MLQIGDAVPAFELPCTDGTRVSNKTLKGQWSVLFFYPKDMTPGCTTENKDFSALVGAFGKAGAAVYGVSKDTLATHAKFSDKESLKVPLLADPEKLAHRAFGVWGEKMMYGKTVEGTIRSTFLISPNGKIAFVWTKLKVAGHAEAVLEKMKELKSGS